MQKIYISLILLVFLSFSFLSHAQNSVMNAAIIAHPDSPSENGQPDRKLPLAQWYEKNQNIRDNFAPMNTVTVYSNGNIAIDLGPAQMMIQFPFF
ncbi:MAG: hypothetical protein Q8P84_04760 [Deltaproteobacteria bacterium]|nr:hypothetical protein [Deltaproteobacteria bacterium]MDZ4225045.1 hypothetical protein [bacterium]